MIPKPVLGQAPSFIRERTLLRAATAPSRSQDNVARLRKPLSLSDRQSLPTLCHLKMGRATVALALGNLCSGFRGCAPAPPHHPPKP